MNIENGKRDWTPEQVEEVRVSLRAVQAETGWSQAEVARRAEVASSTFSQFMTGNYPTGKYGPIAADLARFLDAYHREAEVRAVEPVEPTFVLTPTGKKVHAALSHAQFLSDISLIVGPPGVGKTAAADQYAARTPRVMKLAARPSLASTNALMMALITEHHPTPALVSARSLAARAQVVRTMLGKGWLLIVDEAQHVGAEALEELRIIHDETKCGLCFIGNPKVLSRIQGEARDASYAQLFGRVGWRVSLTKKDVETDVVAVLETMGVTAAEVVAEAQKVARREDIRVVVKTTRSALSLASGQGVNLSPAHMRAAYRQLAGEAA